MEPTHTEKKIIENSLANVRIYPLGCGFLMPFLHPCAQFVENPGEADFILSMNNLAAGATEALIDAKKFGKPVAWWTIEDPNWFENFITQAAHADFVFTTDEICIPRYRERLGHERIFWLPLACSPELHQPLELADDATDLVLSGNWYINDARQWAIKTLLDPLLEADYTLTLFCYEDFMWSEPYRRFWKAQTHYLTTAEQYRYGRVVLGMNNQRSGMDGIEKTFMTSMRTFEALACGKPFLSSHSDAFERLGFVNGEHFVWVSSQTEALIQIEKLLGTEGLQIAEAGRDFVLANHTYAHRLARIAEAVLENPG
ncbi:MAG: glycosyltransferase [Pyrinomonadaceae bacterium]|nr:glycosyltransferase [Pyrinomonadaceae bacterium]